MLFRAPLSAVCLSLLTALPAAAQIRELSPEPGVGTTLEKGLAPFAATPDHQRRYLECMKLARSEPLKALPVAEKWKGEGGGLGARHCVAIAMFESGKYVQAANQFEAIARDMGNERPGLQAELYAQAGQGWMEAGQAENAATAQSRALELKADDPDLWIDRGLSYAAMKAWPRAISDFDHALDLRAKDVDTVVLRAAAWRNAGDARRALGDAQYALRLAPEHSEALLERGFDYLALGDRAAADRDFKKVAELVPPGSSAALRAAAGLRGELPGTAAEPPAAKGGKKG
ncbi:MAG: tetratricopeptide repeat protein [Proteobacteria bacterium]|nr:tetratricopeptide repeat protein [Pseudomonadota bacterium]